METYWAQDRIDPRQYDATRAAKRDAIARRLHEAKSAEVARKQIARDRSESTRIQRGFDANLAWDQVPGIYEAQRALETAMQDCIADHGEQVADGAWGDIVHAVAAMCPPVLAQALIRRNL